MIVLLPGLGADRRLFRAQVAAFPGLVVPPWPDPRPDDSLATFAERLIPDLPPAENLYVGGCSFGGMVACEIAARVRPRAVLLVASCTHPSAFTPWSTLARLVAPLLPERAYRPDRRLAPLVWPWFGGDDAEQEELFWSMAATVTPAFLRWGLRASLAWQPSRVEVPIHHIHGEADRLMPIDRVRPDRVVPGAGHLLALTHADVVNRFLREKVDG